MSEGANAFAYETGSMTAKKSSFGRPHSGARRPKSGRGVPPLWAFRQAPQRARGSKCAPVGDPIQNKKLQPMKSNIASSNRAGRRFGAAYTTYSNSLFRRLALTLPGVLLWLAVLPLAALGQANYATPYTFTTLAGLAGSAGTNDGTGNAARFNGPSFVAVDTNGNVYVADTVNDTIRKVTPGGAVTTLAGLAGSPGSVNGTNSAARFNYPGGVAVDSNGNIYVADTGNHTIREVTPVGTNWVVTTLAGLAGSPGGADGTNSAARFRYPGTVTADTNGNLFVADCYNYTIRKMTPVGTNWVVTTLAGLAGSPGSVDGTGSAARFSGPNGVVMDSAGNLYVPDQMNNNIREGFPASSVPSPVLQPPSLSAGQFGFGITGLPGLAVDIESSSDLLNWQVVGTNVLVGGTNYFVSPNPSQAAQFYRIQVR